MANNGGPAYPGTYLEEFSHTDPDTDDVMEVEHTFKTSAGMSLRDWFAGQIAAAAMTNAEGLGSIDAADRRTMFGQAASIAYEFSDAMIAERAKGDANG